MPTWQDVQDVVTYYDNNKGFFRNVLSAARRNAGRAECMNAYAHALVGKTLDAKLTHNEIAALLCTYTPSTSRNELRDRCFEMLAPKLLGIELPKVPKQDENEDEDEYEHEYEHVPQYSARHVVDFVLFVGSYINVTEVLDNFKQPLDRTAKFIALWALGEMVRMYEKTHQKPYGNTNDINTMIKKFLETDHIDDLVTGHPVQEQRPCTLALTPADIPSAASVLKMFDLSDNARRYLPDMLGTLTRAGIYSGDKYDQILEYPLLLLNNVINAEWLRLNANPELLTHDDWETMIHICRLRDTEGKAEIDMNKPNETRAKLIFDQMNEQFTASMGEVITQVLGRNKEKISHRSSF